MKLETQGLAAINGEVSPIESAKIPALDRGFLYGDCVFETLVAFGSHILDLEEHFARLRRSSDILKIDIPWTNEELQKELLDLCLKASSFWQKLNIRLIVSRGNQMGLLPSADLKPNRYVFVTSGITPADWGVGLKLKLTESHPSSRLNEAKTSHYLPSILALKNAISSGYDEIVWFDANRHEITEAATANIFFVGREGDLVEIATPKLEAGVLDGITRRKLIELLFAAKIPVRERTILTEEIPRFDEAFLTSTVRGLVPVALINQHRLHSSRAASVFRHIERLYFASVTRDLGFAVHWHNGQSHLGTVT